jgi:photosystem II oxygen-evolving enhancer protein 2
MWKKVTVSLLMALAIILQINVAPAQAAGLQAYIDTGDSYKFLYPNGWVAVKTTKGADIIFHDLIESSENVSVVILALLLMLAINLAKMPSHRQDLDVKLN